MNFISVTDEDGDRVLIDVARIVMVRAWKVEDSSCRSEVLVRVSDHHCDGVVCRETFIQVLEWISGIR